MGLACLSNNSDISFHSHGILKSRPANYTHQGVSLSLELCKPLLHNTGLALRLDMDSRAQDLAEACAPGRPMHEKYAGPPAFKKIPENLLRPCHG